MSTDAIRAALESRLATWAAGQGLAVAWSGVPFDPPPVTHLRAHLLPASVDGNDIAGLHREYRGVWQVSVHLPAGTGHGAALVIADALDVAFNPAVPISASGFTLHFASPMSPAPAIEEPGWSVIPVSAHYIAHRFT